MGSLDDAMSNAARKGGHRSQLDILLEQLDPEDARQLVEVYLPDRRYSSPQISRAVDALGFTLSRAAIADWRAKNAPR
jgi:hypothetical protein